MAGRGRERAEKKGRAVQGRKRIKEKGRVTFFFFFLGDLESSGGGFSDAAFSTLDLGEKAGERGKGGGSRERRNKGWHGPRGRTNMCCAVLFSSIPSWDSLEWKTVTDVHTKTQSHSKALRGEKSNFSHSTVLIRVYVTNSPPKT